MKLAKIANVTLSRERGVSRAFDILWPKTQMVPELVGGSVEQYMVVSHVQMTVMINPIRLYDHFAGNERSLVNLVHVFFTGKVMLLIREI